MLWTIFHKLLPPPNPPPNPLLSFLSLKWDRGFVGMIAADLTHLLRAGIWLIAMIAMTGAYKSLKMDLSVLKYIAT